MVRVALLAAAVLTLVGPGGRQHIRNSRIAFVHINGNRFQIYTMTTTGTQRHPLTTSRRFSNYEPSYAPDGDRIAFVHAYKQRDIWTMNADGENERPLTRTKRIDEDAPAWSPDGKEVAFAVESPASQRGIWVISVNGQNRHEVTRGQDGNASWSPDGTSIAFDRYNAATQIHSLLVVGSNGGTPTILSSNPSASDFDPAWSPDGTRILFTSDRPDMSQLDLWVMKADGSDVQRVTNTPSRDESGASWSPDGRKIAYSGQGAFHGASSSQIYVSNANGAQRRVLTHACGDCARVNEQPSWQPKP